MGFYYIFFSSLALYQDLIAWDRQRRVQNRRKKMDEQDDKKMI